MEIDEYLKAHGLTDEMLDEMAAPYERGDWESDGSPVYWGSHYDAVERARKEGLPLPGQDPDFDRAHYMQPNEESREALREAREMIETGNYNDYESLEAMRADLGV